MPDERLSGEKVLGRKRSLKGKGGDEGWRKKGCRKGKAVVRDNKGDREKEREAVSKAAVNGAASGVIPKVVVATRTSTRTRFGARRVRKGLGTRRTAWRTSSRRINTTWRRWRTAAGEHCVTLRTIGLDHLVEDDEEDEEAPVEEELSRAKLAGPPGLEWTIIAP